jgi:hypothetical protein
MASPPGRKVRPEGRDVLLVLRELRPPRRVDRGR